MTHLESHQSELTVALRGRNMQHALALSTHEGDVEVDFVPAKQHAQHRGVAH